MDIRIKVLLYIFLFCFISVNSLYALDAKEIVRMADEKVRGKTNKAKAVMTVKRRTWSRSISMELWGKGYEYSMILITSPARDKGTVFLKRKNEVWNWIPKIERIVKIPPSMMGQSWMGSDFKNDDLVMESSVVHDYNHYLEGEEMIGEYMCYKIKLIPKPEAPVVWGKVLLWISKHEYYQLRVEFYDEDENAVNIMISSEIKQTGGKRIPTRLEMIRRFIPTTLAL